MEFGPSMVSFYWQTHGLNPSANARFSNSVWNSLQLEKGFEIHPGLTFFITDLFRQQ